MLRTACDTSQHIITERKGQFPNVDYTDSFESILTSPEIKAVTIASPVTTHYQLAKQSLLAGKDVYVEKPLSLTVAEGQKLVNIAEREGRESINGWAYISVSSHCD